MPVHVDKIHIRATIFSRDIIFRSTCSAKIYAGIHVVRAYTAIFNSTCKSTHETIYSVVFITELSVKVNINEYIAKGLCTLMKKTHSHI